jgi:hypothetical protein
MNIQELEKQRLWLLTIAWYNKLIRISLVIFWLYVWLVLGTNLAMAVMLFLVCYGFTVVWFSLNYDFFRDDFRSSLLNDFVSKIQGAKYTTDDYMSMDSFNKSKLFKPIKGELDSPTGMSFQTKFTNVNSLLKPIDGLLSTQNTLNLSNSIKSRTIYKGEDLIQFTSFGNLELSELDIDQVETIKDSEGKEIELSVKFFKGIFGVASFPFIPNPVPTFTTSRD